MANEVADEWKLEPSIKSKKVIIDGVVKKSFMIFFSVKL